MELTTVWFGVVALFWVGYLVLEGFDFGVGVLAPVLSDDLDQRGAALETIGPVWDGNEVWLIVAIGATFAAFPDWYATMLSGFYLPLLLALVALIVRAVGLEYRHKQHDDLWRRRWDAAITAGSVVAPLVWGLLLTNLAGGLAVDADREITDGLLGVLGPYALLGAVTFLALFVLHGATFLALRTSGPVHERAGRTAVRVGVVAVPLAAGLVGWTALRDGGRPTLLVAATAVVALLLAVVAAARGRDGLAFAGSAVGVAAVVSTLFVALFPDVVPSTLDPAWSLTTDNASSSPYTLTIMSWAALAITPFVLAYQAWTYWVFRRRVVTDPVPTATADAA